MKKAIAALMVFSMLLPVVSCNQISDNSLEKIKISDAERAWKCSDEKYKELLESYDGYVCSGAVVVATDKDIVYLYTEDAFEKDGKTKVSQDTVFDIASCSKTFTAVCILQLMEKGKLSLEDTLDKYFPEYEKGKKITISNLLHMNSGIPDYLNNPDPFWNISGADAANKKISDILQDRTTDDELLKAMYKAPLDFEPGTEYGYSNTNYRLLAFIIEKLSGMKYCDYVKKNIFDKCGMKKTTSMATGDMTYVPVDYSELVKYGFTDKDGYPACPNNTRGDGGIHSCLTDMIAFDRALFGGKLLDQKSMEILLKDDGGYCCGLVKNKNGYSHDGSSLTCGAKNKIIESEEFGHIYVIKLERTGIVPEFSGEDPMQGTKFTEGVFSDGTYSNEYAGLKVKAPEGWTVLSKQEILEMDSGAEFENSKDRTRFMATRHDATFWKNGESIHVYYLNSKLGVPDDRDYTEDDYLNDATKEYEGYGVTDSNRTKVTIAGKEYTRAELVLQFNGKEAHLYFYARKLDDNLLVMIECDSMSDKRSDYFEKLFL